MHPQHIFLRDRPAVSLHGQIAALQGQNGSAGEIHHGTKLIQNQAEEQIQIQGGGQVLRNLQQGGQFTGARLHALFQGLESHLLHALGAVMFHGHIHQVRARFDDLQLRRGGQARALRIDREGGDDRPAGVDHRLRPAGQQPIAQGRLAQPFPARIRADILHQHALAGVAGRAAGAHQRANLDALNFIQISLRQADSPAHMQTAAGFVQNERQAHHPRPLFFHHLYQRVQGFSQAAPAGQQLQKLALAVLNGLGALVFHGIGDDLAHHVEHGQAVFIPGFGRGEGIKTQIAQNTPLVRHGHGRQRAHALAFQSQAFLFSFRGQGVHIVHQQHAAVQQNAARPAHLPHGDLAHLCGARGRARPHPF